jgi:hypothetical protein
MAQQGRVLMRIKRSGAWAAVVLLMGSLAFTAPLFAQNTESSHMPKVGEMAPDFTLHYFDGSDLKAVKLSDFRGKQNVVLAFYVFAFTGG